MTRHSKDPYASYVLGDTREQLDLQTVEENRAVGIHMLGQARRTVNITSRNLDPRLYDDSDFIEAARQFAISSPKVVMRILVNDPDLAVKNGHRLIELMRRLSSFIEIRVQGKTFQDYNEASLVIDEQGYIYRLHADRYNAEADYCAPRRARELNKQFELMWQDSVTDPNLRRLHL